MKSQPLTLLFVICTLAALAVPALARNPFYQGREHCNCAKSIDVLTDRLLSHYRNDLKRCGCWKPRGRAKILYNAVFEFEKRADHLRSAFDNRCSDDFIACRLERVDAAARIVHRALRRVDVSDCFYDLLGEIEGEIEHMAEAFVSHGHDHH